MIEKFRFIYNAMCVFEQFYQTDEPVWNEKEVADFYRPFANTGVNFIRVCYQCFGRDLGVTKYKTMILPWVVVNGKADLSKKNQKYFDLAKQLFKYFNSIGLGVYFNPLNACEDNNQERWKWAVFNKINNVQGVDNIDDPKTQPYILKYIGWCLEEFKGLNMVWQPINEANISHLNLITAIGKTMKASGITADKIAYSICLDLAGGNANHAELIRWRDDIWNDDTTHYEDAMDRCNHGLAKDPQGRFYDVLAGVKFWTFCPSTDGGNRDSITPELFTTWVHDGLNKWTRQTIQLGPDRLNRLKFSVEHMITPVIDDIAVLDAGAIEVEKFFGEEMPNRGKYPPLADECTMGQVKKQTCWDGSEITTHTCENGKWKETGETCPTPECTAGQIKTETCADGSVITTHTCENGKWKETGNICPNVRCSCWYYLNIHDTLFGIPNFIKCIRGKIDKYCK